MKQYAAITSRPWLFGALVTSVGFVALVGAAQFVDDDSANTMWLLVGAVLASIAGSVLGAVRTPGRENTGGTLAVLVPSASLQILGMAADLVTKESLVIGSRLGFVMLTTLIALLVATVVSMVRARRRRRLSLEP